MHRISPFHIHSPHSFNCALTVLLLSPLSAVVSTRCFPSAATPRVTRGCGPRSNGRSQCSRRRHCCRRTDIPSRGPPQSIRPRSCRRSTVMVAAPPPQLAFPQALTACMHAQPCAPHLCLRTRRLCVHVRVCMYMCIGISNHVYVVLCVCVCVCVCVCSACWRFCPYLCIFVLTWAIVPVCAAVGAGGRGLAGHRKVQLHKALQTFSTDIQRASM